MDARTDTNGGIRVDEDGWGGKDARVPYRGARGGKNEEPPGSPRGLDRGEPYRVERRRATLPHPLGCSTIAVQGLSFRVRNGTGRLTLAMAAANLVDLPRDTPGGSDRDGPGTGQWTRKKSCDAFRTLPAAGNHPKDAIRATTRNPDDGV